MARPPIRVAQSDVLRVHNPLNSHFGTYVYQLATKTDRSACISGGGRSISVSLSWAFGEWTIGQSYPFERPGNLYKSGVVAQMV
jgi:hypothetical protein